MTPLRTTTFPSIGTTATMVSRTDDHEAAVAVMRVELAAIDKACSRFRDDSELTAVNASAGRPVPVSPLFMEALRAALRAARITDGLVDPTVGRALRLLGYDRDFAALDRSGPALVLAVRRVPGWRAVTIDEERSTVTVPIGVELDFGATAKALCADRVARRASESTGAGVLVSLGGDVAVAGEPPEEGWPVGVADFHGAAPEDVDAVVAVRSGGLATSTTTARRWKRGGQVLHHLVDPRSGRPAHEHWRTVTVAAGSCLDANVASCAAILMGPKAPDWLGQRRLAARLVRPDGQVVTAADWPEHVTVVHSR